ncbi:MAG: NAD(P)H-dependent oxidoreductase [Spirochaetales bacterium]|nr:NAD(P)H-dependent oxidoreductase [Spirochaetales bacterium]
MKITAFVGSARKAHSFGAAEEFLKYINDREKIDFEIVNLHDYKLGICRGCKLCTDKGEELCPLKDDRDRLIAKMRDSEGVVFVSPNYTFQVSGMMKVFLDRLAFICHRPEFFGKTFTSIVPQGIFGGGKIVKYLDFIGAPMGFNVVKGSSITTLEPMTDKGKARNTRVLNRHASRFYKRLKQNSMKTPNLFELTMFRLSRTKIKTMQDETSGDYRYYRDNGWFDSPFYYPVKLGPVKILTGKLVDSLSR